MEEIVNKSIQVIGFTADVNYQQSATQVSKDASRSDMILLRAGGGQEEFRKVLDAVKADEIMLVDLHRVTLSALNVWEQDYRKMKRGDHVLLRE